MTEAEEKTMNEQLIHYGFTSEQKHLTRMLVDLRLKASIPQQLMDIIHRSAEHIALYR